MAEFNADKLSEPLENRDLERLTMTRKLLEELLKDLEGPKPVPKRSGETDPSSRCVIRDLPTTAFGR